MRSAMRRHHGDLQTAVWHLRHPSGKTAVLVGTIHVAHDDYFRDLADTVQALQDRLAAEVHYELITRSDAPRTPDEDDLLARLHTVRMTRMLADLLGFASQHAMPLRPDWTNTDLDGWVHSGSMRAKCRDGRHDAEPRGRTDERRDQNGHGRALVYARADRHRVLAGTQRHRPRRDQHGPRGRARARARRPRSRCGRHGRFGLHHTPAAQTGGGILRSASDRPRCGPTRRSRASQRSRRSASPGLRKR